MSRPLDRAWELVAVSVRTLRDAPGLLTLPVAASVVWGLCAAAAYGVLWFLDVGARGHNTRLWVATAVVEVAAQIVATFSGGAVVAWVVERARGETPTVRHALRVSTARRTQLLELAALELLARLLGGYLPVAGRLVDVSGSIATFLVLPIVIVDGCGPVVALRRAVPLVAETWSEQLVGLVIFGWLVTLVAVPTIPVWGIYFISWGTFPPSPFVWAAALWMLALKSLQFVLLRVYQAAVYLRVHDIPPLPPLAGHAVVVGAD